MDPFNGFTVKRNRDGKAARGEALRWLDEVAIPYDGDECLTYPFYRAPSGHGALSGRNGPSFAHVYVANAVYGEKPSADMECRHICGNGHIGCVTPSHLRWGTRAENMQDRKEHGTLTPPPVMRGEANFKSRYTEDQARAVKLALKRGEGPMEIKRRLGVGRGFVYSVKYGYTWSWLHV